MPGSVGKTLGYIDVMRKQVVHLEQGQVLRRREMRDRISIRLKVQAVPGVGLGQVVDASPHLEGLPETSPTSETLSITYQKQT